MIVDKCPGCGVDHLDLFQNAFAELAPMTKGVIDVNWEHVDCPISSPLQVHLQSGASEWWFSAQVINADKIRHPL